MNVRLKSGIKIRLNSQISLPLVIQLFGIMFQCALQV